MKKSCHLHRRRHFRRRHRRQGLLDGVVGANYWGCLGTFGTLWVEVRAVTPGEASKADPGGAVGAAKEKKTKWRGESRR